MEEQPKRNPEEWKTGDEPMTDAQASYLRTLSDDVGEPFDPHLTKAQASERIDELQRRSPRLADDETTTGTPGGESGTPPHPSQAEGGSRESSDRAPRLSQAEGER